MTARSAVSRGTGSGTGTGSVFTASGIAVHVLETPSLGDRSHLVHDGAVAVVVDSQRDIDRVLDLLDEQQIRLTHVCETHVHNDHVSGGHALAAQTDAAYLVNADDEVGFERTPVCDGQVIAVGERMLITAIATPGHTFTHLSYALSDVVTGERVALFSGGSLLFGATGRPDLLGEGRTHELVHLQHAYAHKLAAMLPADVQLFPTHGFGSFCSATQSDAASSTIGGEALVNPALTSDRQTFVRELLAGLGAYRAYYAHMAPLNLAGPEAPDLLPPTRAEPVELRRRIQRGEWAVDLRHRSAFAAGHQPGSLNFGLDGGFATHLGWLLDWGAPLTLPGDSPAQVSAARRELVRIGIDRPSAAATGTPDGWGVGTGYRVAAFPTASFADLARVSRHRMVNLIAVRRNDEHERASIGDAMSFPLHQLRDRLKCIPQGQVWVHCAGGYRACVAASLLAASGFDVVAIDDTFENASRAGLRLTHSAAA